MRSCYLVSQLQLAKVLPYTLTGEKVTVKVIWKAERYDDTYFEPTKEALAKFNDNMFQGFISLGQPE